MKITKSQLVLMAALASPSAFAGPVSYARKAVDIKAGVVILDSQRTSASWNAGVSLSPAPHVFGQLDKQNSIKPPGWNYVNPRAESALSRTQFDRWVALNTFYSGTGVPAAGSRLTKADAPYWEVDLSQISTEGLSEYDVLCLPVSGNLQLGTIDREKLRRFVDGGGVLWIDLHSGTGVTTDLANPAPIPFDLASAGGPLFIDFTHPVLNRPNRVTPNEIFRMQGQGTDSLVPFAAGGLLQSWVSSDYERLVPVVGESDDSITMGLGRIGDGYLFVTTRGLSAVLNSGFNGSNFTFNRTFRAAPPGLGRFSTAVGKLVTNVIALQAQYSGEASSAHNTNSIRAEIEAPLLRRFSTTAAVSVPPAHYGGRVFVVNGDQLVSFDAGQKTDLDGNGNPDDGVLDLPSSQFDRLWDVRAGGALSAPVCTEIRTGGTSRSVVLVTVATRGNTTLQMYDMISGALLNSFTGPASDGSTEAPASGIPGAPTVHEGLAFITDTLTTNRSGRIWVVDLNRQAVLATANGPFSVRRAQRFTASINSPTVGYLPIQDNSGGVDKVVYCPMAGDTGKSTGFVSLWFGSRGESPSSVIVNGGNLTVTTRAALQNLPILVTNDSFGLKVSLRRLDPATGQDLGPIPAGQIGNYLTGAVTVGGQNGVINLGLGPVGLGSTWSGAGQDVALRLDYTIDWTANATTGIRANPESFIRGDLQFPDEIGNQSVLLGNLALAPNGNLFAVVAPPDTAANDGYGGALYCIRETGRGDFRILYRWDAHDRFRYNTLANTAPQFDYDPAIIDYDGLLSAPGFGNLIDRPMRLLRFAGGPTVSGDRVFVSVTGAKAIPFIPAGDRTRFASTVLAFNADPSPLEVEIDGLTTTNFAILQPDLARTPSGQKATPTVLSVLQPGQANAYSFERTANGGSITMSNSASATRGRIRDVISSNLPFIIRRSGQPDIIIEPELTRDSPLIVPNSPLVPGNAFGKWNQQVYQVVFNGLNLTAQPFKAGDNLFFAGGSFLPSLFNVFETGGGFNFTQIGLVYAMTASIAPSDLRSPTAKRNWMSTSVTARSWQRYHSTIDFGTFNPGSPGDTAVTPSTYITMPSSFGIRSFDDFRTRVRQAALNSSTVSGIVGGEETISIWDPSRYYLFGQGRFTIVDEGRVIRVDSNGNPLWSSDTTINEGQSEPTGEVGRVLNIGKASRAYSTIGNGFAIADPAGNRIAEVDSSGRELRTITEFKLDPRFQPAGMVDNPVLSLSQPQDAITFTSIQPQATNPFSNVTGAEYWVHTMIADTGNQRMIELVDRFEYDPARRVIGALKTYSDPTSRRPGQIESALGVLRWQIKSELTSKRYSYTSIDRTFFADASGNLNPIFSFGFGNTRPSASALGLDGPSGPLNPVPDNAGGSGGVVLYDPARGANKVISEYNRPAVPANIFWNNATATFNSPALPARSRVPIQGLRNATISFVDMGGPSPVLAVMITDNSGVYELIESAPGTWTTSWWLPREAFVAMRRNRVSGNDVLTTKNPTDFQPTFARRLSSGEVLVVNGYVGRHRAEPWVAQAFGISRGDSYSGEVVVFGGGFAPGTGTGFSWTNPNLGFNNFYINFELPPIQGVRGLIAPQFVDKQ